MTTIARDKANKWRRKPQCGGDARQNSMALQAQNAVALQTQNTMALQRHGDANPTQWRRSAEALQAQNSGVAMASPTQNFFDDRLGIVGRSNRSRNYISNLNG